jgi:oligopeptide/dipeptide ABC transporter ATP-binding protein
MLGIVGESGSGKTMTAMAIAQLVPYPGRVFGTVRAAGQDVADLPPARLSRFLARALAIVFQDPMSSLNPTLSVKTQLTEGVQVMHRTKPSAATALALDRLREVRLPAPERQLRSYAHELSGGMRQRVMIAMGLMTDPAILIADEPTTALDVTVQAQIMDLLRRLNRERGMAIILISHNLALVRQNCGRVLVMYAGRIVEVLSTDDLVRGARHPYTRALVAAVPDDDHPPDMPLASIAGQPPDAAQRPAGCAFHPRCPVAVDRCRTETPPLVQKAGTLAACWVANNYETLA